MSFDDFARKLGGKGATFEIVVQGPREVAPLTNTTAGYWEWVVGQRDGEEWVSYQTPEHSSAESEAPHLPRAVVPARAREG